MPDALDRLEEGWMVGDDEVAACLQSLVRDGVGEVDGEHRPGDGGGGVAGEQAGVVPRLGPAEGSDGVEDGEEVLQDHGGDAAS